MQAIVFNGAPASLPSFGIGAMSANPFTLPMAQDVAYTMESDNGSVAMARRRRRRRYR